MGIRVTTPGGSDRNGLPGPRFYRYQGDPDWDPAKAAIPPRRPPSPCRLREEAEERRARFAELRDQGMSREEAGAAVGIKPKTAWQYEVDKKRGEAP
jgi:hypothetical protein